MTTGRATRALARTALAAFAALAALGTTPVCRQIAAQTLKSQPSDSIVKLAADPALRQGTALTTLLDELEFRVEADGRSTRRRRQVFLMMNDAAARSRAEQSFSFSPSHQRFALNWVRVLKPNGEVISDKPAQEQDADVPAAMRNPVYQDQKIRRLSLAGLAAGTILDLSWTLEEKAPYRAGDFYEIRYVNSPVDVVRFRYVLDAPESLQPRIVEYNLNVKRTESVANGRRVTTWAANDLPHVVGEAFMADSNDVIQGIAVASPSSWNDIGMWYHGLSKDRYQLTPAVAQRVDSVVSAANARTRLDTVKALHRWAAQDVRYVSVALGIGGYQPRTPDEVLATGIGDCKDKATLFVAAVRKFGIEANPVLLSNTGHTDRNAPSIFQFNHEIAAVRNGTGWTYTDLTAEAIPFGMIPLSYQGGMGLMVLPDGKSDVITFPASPPDSNTSVVRIIGELRADGAVVMRVDDRAVGTPSLGTRQSFFSPVDSTARAGAMRAIGSVYFKDGSADSLRAFNGKDLSADVHISFRVQGTNVLKSVGTVKLFTMPATMRGPAPGFGNLANNLAAAPTRKFPVDVSRIVGPYTTSSQFELTLPVGWVAELPKNVVTTSIVGKYSTSYVQEGRVLRITRMVQGARGIYAPVRIAEVISWLRTISADDLEFVQLKPPV
ncbi:MAG: DUF3857 and transglutaminase domain-containing protein [Gemmatimonadaceae bacterium]